MADPTTYRPTPGEIPTDPGVYRFRDAHGRVIYVGKAKSLRPRLSSYFQDITALHPRTATMVTTAASRRVDRRAHRGRGAPARVLLDQGVRPALQRQVPRRQVLPLPRRHDGRGVPARPGDARREAQGHPLLRALRATRGRSARPSTCCCASSRCAPARSGVFKRAAAERAAVPARLHRQVLGALRRPGHARGAPRHRRGLLRLHGRQHDPFRQATRDADEAGGAPSSTSSRPHGCATTSAP